jgi:hypothetical protein
MLVSNDGKAVLERFWPSFPLKPNLAFTPATRVRELLEEMRGALAAAADDA